MANNIIVMITFYQIFFGNFGGLLQSSTRQAYQGACLPISETYVSGRIAIIVLNGHNCAKWSAIYNRLLLTRIAVVHVK